MKATKEHQRKKRHNKIRSRVIGTAKRPRLAVFRSLKSIYVQLIDDSTGKVLASSSGLKIKKGKGIDVAKQVGIDIAKKAKDKKVKTCIFDRGGYLYHGRIKALTEGAREGGLQF